MHPLLFAERTVLLFVHAIEMQFRNGGQLFDRLRVEIAPLFQPFPFQEQFGSTRFALLFLCKGVGRSAVQCLELRIRKIFPRGALSLILFQFL